MADKYYPFPINLDEYPEVRKLTALQFGCVRRMIDNYWLTGEMPPESEFKLRYSLNCSNHGWVEARKKVYKIFNMLIPRVSEEREKILETKRKLRENGLRTIKLVHERRLAKKAQLSDENDSHFQVKPVPPPIDSGGWHPGQYDKTARSDAIQSNKKDDGTTFTD